MARRTHRTLGLPSDGYEHTILNETENTRSFVVVRRSCVARILVRSSVLSPAPPGNNDGRRGSRIRCARRRDRVRTYHTTPLVACVASSHLSICRRCGCSSVNGLATAARSRRADRSAMRRATTDANARVCTPSALKCTDHPVERVRALTTGLAATVGSASSRASRSRGTVAWRALTHTVDFVVATKKHDARHAQQSRRFFSPSSRVNQQVETIDTNDTSRRSVVEKKAPSAERQHTP